MQVTKKIKVVEAGINLPATDAKEILEKILVSLPLIEGKVLSVEEEIASLKEETSYSVELDITVPIDNDNFISARISIDSYKKGNSSWYHTALHYYRNEKCLLSLMDHRKESNKFEMSYIREKIQKMLNTIYKAIYLKEKGFEVLLEE